MNDRLISACKKSSKIFFMVDNYGPNLSRKIDKIKILLEGANINHSIRKYYGEDAHLGGWIDYGLSPERKICKKEDIKKHFDTCLNSNSKRLGFLLTIFGNVLFACPNARIGYRIGFIPLEACKYLDLSDNNISDEEKMKMLLDMKNPDYLEACAYCNGIHDGAKRYMPAEQLA
jgi:hypothetical protein